MQWLGFLRLLTCGPVDTEQEMSQHTQNGPGVGIFITSHVIRNLGPLPTVWMRARCVLLVNMIEQLLWFLPEMLHPLKGRPCLGLCLKWTLY